MTPAFCESRTYHCTLIRDGVPTTHSVSAIGWRAAALRTLSENGIGRSEDVIVKVYFDEARENAAGKLTLNFDLL